MNNLKISDYLENCQKSQGKCKICHKAVTWSQERLAAHKRANCPAATQDEKRKFLKRPRESSSTLVAPVSSASTPCSCKNLSAEKNRILTQS